MKGAEFFKDDFGEYLKAVMIEKGIKIQVLADKTGYSYTGVRKILAGEGSYEGVFLICQALKVNMKKVLKERPILGE